MKRLQSEYYSKILGNITRRQGYYVYLEMMNISENAWFLVREWKTKTWNEKDWRLFLVCWNHKLKKKI